MAALNNATSADDYTMDNQLDFQPTKAVTITINNAAVYGQFATAEAGQTYSAPGAYPYNAEDKMMLPGVYVARPEDFQDKLVAGFRFKSAALGVPAQVSISA